MTAAFIIGLALILAAAGGAVWLIHHIYSGIVQVLSADNYDLKNRLFTAKGLPPSGVDVTAQYEERKQDQQQRKAVAQENSKKHPSLGAVRDRWADKDRKMAQAGIDATNNRIN